LPPISNKYGPTICHFLGVAGILIKFTTGHCGHINYLTNTNVVTLLHYTGGLNF
jgi:hypothetical protein